MTRREVVLKNESGLHARPASAFVREASKYVSKIEVTKGEENKKCNAKSILGLLSMGASKGEKIIIEANGEDEEIAVQKLSDFINEIKE